MFFVKLALWAALQPTYAVLIGMAVLTLDLIAIVAVVLGHGSAMHKLIWTAAVLLLPLVGVILYVVCAKRDADRRLLD